MAPRHALAARLVVTLALAATAAAVAGATPRTLTTAVVTAPARGLPTSPAPPSLSANGDPASPCKGDEPCAVASAAVAAFGTALSRAACPSAAAAASRLVALNAAAALLADASAVPCCPMSTADAAAVAAALYGYGGAGADPCAALPVAGSGTREGWTFDGRNPEPCCEEEFVLNGCCCPVPCIQSAQLFGSWFTLDMCCGAPGNLLPLARDCPIDIGL